jgi:hypothetical protein
MASMCCCILYAKADMHQTFDPSMSKSLKICTKHTVLLIAVLR